MAGQRAADPLFEGLMAAARARAARAAEVAETE
jgi:hypothetical protein